jgi:CRISPR/Cas system CSM-associated protein Csm3 (group 7 of RAMP superfamily)
VAAQLWSAAAARGIAARLIVEGDLVLETAAHLGNGDGDDLTDMPLLVDAYDGRTPLLTGASIAGALRSYLRQREQGYRGLAGAAPPSVLLFGGVKGDKEGEQSPLIVEDALGTNGSIELRDGVRINPASRTADNDKLFNIELWEAGATFALRFELLLPAKAERAGEMKQALATALGGLEDDSITLGARKRRGYGRVRVTGWRAKSYDLRNPAALLAWIERGDEPLADAAEHPEIRAALEIAPLSLAARKRFSMDAWFALDGSLLIRSGMGRDDQGPDMVHLHARHSNGEREPILSGTSVAGALRARARRIARTLGTADAARELVDSIFGVEIRVGLQPIASRVRVREAAIEGAVTDLVQNRVSIDPFTGGARHTALFNEQPVFGAQDTTVRIGLVLDDPNRHDIGLLLLLLKDLWTADLPLGGESGVGRGRLEGRRAELVCEGGQSPRNWDITAAGDALSVSGHDASWLEGCVTALQARLKGGAHETPDPGPRGDSGATASGRDQ